MFTKPRLIAVFAAAVLVAGVLVVGAIGAADNGASDQIAVQDRCNHASTPSGWFHQRSGSHDQSPTLTADGPLLIRFSATG